MQNDTVSGCRDYRLPSFLMNLELFQQLTRLNVRDLSVTSISVSRTFSFTIQFLSKRFNRLDAIQSKSLFCYFISVHIALSIALSRACSLSDRNAHNKLFLQSDCLYCFVTAENEFTRVMEARLITDSIELKLALRREREKKMLSCCACNALHGVSGCSIET